MKSTVLSFLLAVFVSLSLTGCTGAGGGGVAAVPGAETLSNEDLAGVEASLLADRVDQAIALDTVPALVPSIAADVAGTGEFQRRGRRYRGTKSQSGWQVQRADGTCEVSLMPGAAGWRVNVGSEACSVTRLEDGSLKIARGNGTELLVGPIPAEGGSTTIDVNGITWNAVYGTGSEPLVTLTNTRSGRVLTVTESETGDLTVVPSGGGAFHGRWNSDGEVDCTDGAGRQYRYRGGR